MTSKHIQALNLSQYQVFIVEDEAIISNNLSRKLQKKGFSNIHVMSSGESAIQLAKKVTPQLVIIDILLAQGMDGFETAYLLSQQCHAKFIFTSADFNHENKRLIKDLKGCQFMQKPYQFEDLFELLGKTLLGNVALTK
ncbi:MAG: hypothetical protein CL521_01815 [Actinobacteria bacterium]|nr:hypothetical protein [Actinomycetota bacterium]|tara:strand:- start:249 stop:665 length:417 start_codon:yes stop_codon:yes gene_type:complete